VEDGGDTAARGYADLGEHVASILNAAEQAGEQMRADAAREADELRRSARDDARSHVDSERHRATDEAERLVTAAIADARAIRDTARAAARRIAEEGQRRLHELRTDARALESRFETAVEDLHDLIGQLDDVVQDSIGRDERREPDARPEQETPVADLWPRAVPDPADEPEPAEPAGQPDEQHTHPA
jgi:hypothetical protein